MWEEKESGMFRARRISLLEFCGFGFEEDVFFGIPEECRKMVYRKV